MQHDEKESATGADRPLCQEIPIEARELRELLNRSWMTHDGMWFRHCLEACGIEKTNQINKAVIYSAAKIEVRRLTGALATERIETFAALYTFILQAMAIVKADFMKFEYMSPEHNVLRWEIASCFAFEGVKRLGVVDRYECGIFERVKGWLDGLGIAYTITPEVTGCMMHSEGRCFREFHFQFEEDGGNHEEP